MRAWVAEAVNKPEENDLLIKHLVQELKDAESGSNSVSVGGDTLVFAAKTEGGDLDIYECTIRRVSKSVLGEEVAATPTIQVEQRYLS